MSDPRTPPARFASGVFVTGFAALFALAVGLHLHGFSFPIWDEILATGNEPVAGEVLLGTPRFVRVDDWGVQLPVALAQVAHEPAFPVVNENLGLGQNMLVPPPTPVWHPIALFRPTTWGFFLGRDLGLSWAWWSQLLGLVAVWTLVAREVCGGRWGAGLLGGLLLAFSPFVQFWSVNAAPIVVPFGLAWLAAVRLLRATRPLAIGLLAALLAWAAAGAALTLYPPFQIAVAQLLLILFVAVGLEGGRLPRPGRWHLGAAGLAALAVAAVIAGFWLSASDAIAVVRQTEYPGQRVATGGDRPLWWLLGGNLALALWTDAWGPMGNVCEAASFWLFSPVVAGVAAWRWIRTRSAPDAPTLLLSAYAAALWLYCAAGLPEWVARATGLSLVPGSRALLALGMADSLLVVRFAYASTPARGSTGTGHAIAGAALWMAALAAVASRLRGFLPALELAGPALAIALNGGIALALIQPRLRRIAPAGILLASVGSSLWFNPLVRGGADSLTRHPLVEALREIDREAGGESRWLVYGGRYLASLPLIAAVQGLNGVQPVPQLDLWRRIDPEGAAAEIYNRYAHATVDLPGARGEGFELQADDAFVVYLDPEGERIRALGATHLLVPMDRQDYFFYFLGFEPRFRHRLHSVFELPLRKPAPRAGASGTSFPPAASARSSESRSTVGGARTSSVRPSGSGTASSAAWSWTRAAGEPP